MKNKLQELIKNNKFSINGFGKRMLALMLAMAMILCLAACKKNESGEEQKQDDPALVDPAAELKLELSQLPRIDGATAMLPYYKEMVARICGVTEEEAASHILCTTTNNAYYNLIEGNVDMIFCAPPSEDQMAFAKNAGFTFGSEQVLNSGFVFFVNKANPVKSLTKQQIHDIYAGKITNWKEVGGNDEEIIAYQRSEGSGSQSGLYQHVIPQYEVMEAPTEYKIEAMAGIVDAVAEYNNSSAAIGYSYYYYVTQMHYQDDVKLIAIDGVVPNNETISTGLYPFISRTSVFFNKDVAEDSVVRKIVAWCASSAGEKLAEDLGYVPSKDAKTVIPAYKTVKPTKKIINTITYNNISTEKIVTKTDEWGYDDMSYLQISGLKDTKVQEKINKTILDTYNKFVSEPAVSKYVGGAKKSEGKNVELSHMWMSVENNCNNILSIEVVAGFEGPGYDPSYQETECLNFDLNTGKLIKVTDLFDNKTNGLEYINASLWEQLRKNGDTEDYMFDRLCLTAPFPGITEDQKFFCDFQNGIVTLVFDYETPYIYVNEYPVSASVSLEGYSDFGKFVSKKAIYEDEKVVKGLVSQDLGIGKPVNMGRNLDFGTRNMWAMGQCVTYDNLPDYINEIAKGNEQSIKKLYDDSIAAYDKFDSEGKEAWGDLNVYTDVSRIGKYYTVWEGYVGTISVSDYVSSEFVNFDESHSYIFKEGSPDRLYISDMFTDKENYKDALKAAMHKSVEMDGVRNIYHDDGTSEEIVLDPNSEEVTAIINAAVDNIKGFSLHSDYISLNYDNVEALYYDNVQLGSEYLWSYCSIVNLINYSCFEDGVLNIFD